MEELEKAFKEINKIIFDLPNGMYLARQTERLKFDIYEAIERKPRRLDELLKEGE